MFQKFVAKTLLLSVLGLVLSPILAFYSLPTNQNRALADPSVTPPPPVSNCVSVSGQPTFCLYFSDKTGNTATDYYKKVNLKLPETNKSLLPDVSFTTKADKALEEVKFYNSDGTPNDAYSLKSEAGVLYQIYSIDSNLNLVPDSYIYGTSAFNPIMTGYGILWGIIAKRDVASGGEQTIAAFCAFPVTDNFYTPANIVAKAGVGNIVSDEQTKAVGVLNYLKDNLGTAVKPMASYTGITKDWYEWFSGGTFPIGITDPVGSNFPPPVINVARSDVRPRLTFTLKHVVGPSGTLTIEDNFFYFKLTDAGGVTVDYDTYIRIDMNGKAYLIAYGQDIENPFDDIRLPDDKIKLELNQSSYLSKIVNRVYNPRTEDECSTSPLTIYPKTAGYTDAKKEGSDPLAGQLRRCINTDDNGWLKHWGVTFNKASITDPTGEDKYCSKALVCSSGDTKSIGCLISQALCSVAKIFYDWFIYILDDAQKGLAAAIGFGDKFGDKCN